MPIEFLLFAAHGFMSLDQTRIEARVETGMRALTGTEARENTAMRNYFAVVARETAPMMPNRLERK